MDPKIEWLGHDSFRLTGEKVVYIDPWKIENEPHDADVVLITHDHGDHFVPEDLAKVVNKKTVIAAPEMFKGKIEGDLKIVKWGDKLTLAGVPVEVVAAYNTHPDRQNFHPKSYGGLGFIVTLNGKRIYHTGDTDQIPEMAGIQCDVMFVPVSGVYVMTADEAVKAVNVVKPKLAIPMHYDTLVGTVADAKSLQEQVSVPVKILDKTS